MEDGCNSKTNIFEVIAASHALRTQVNKQTEKTPYFHQLKNEKLKKVPFKASL